MSLYTNPKKTVNDENKIFSVNDLIEKTKDQSQWSLAFGELIFNSDLSNG